MKKLKAAESRLAAREMSEIKDHAADRSHAEMQNALDDSGVKPMVTRSPVKKASRRAAEKNQSEERSSTEGALVLPVVEQRRGYILSSGGNGLNDSNLRPPSNEAELAAQLDDALNALDDLGPVPNPAAGRAARDESAESELF